MIMKKIVEQVAKREEIIYEVIRNFTKAYDEHTLEQKRDLYEFMILKWLTYLPTDEINILHKQGISLIVKKGGEMAKKKKDKKKKKASKKKSKKATKKSKKKSKKKRKR